MTHPPVYHRDRALRRLSLVTKGLALSAILATGGVVAAIAHASPAQQSAGSTVPKAPGSADRVSVPRNTAPQPASRGRSRLPAVPTASTPQRRGAAPNRSTGSNPAPPPARPTAPPETAPPYVPEPSPSGGS